MLIGGMMVFGRSAAAMGFFALMMALAVPTGTFAETMTEVSSAGEQEQYEASVTLQGGSGRASVTSPCNVKVVDGTMMAVIEWSSPYYDYMIVDGKKYEPVNTEGNSCFEIPIASLEDVITVKADTTAMSEPYEIEYTLVFGSEAVSEQITSQESEAQTKALPDLTFDYSMDLLYAQQFSVDYYENGYVGITIADKDEYLLVPEGKAVPETLDSSITVLQQPLSNIYLAATASMDYFAAMDACDAIRLSGTQTDGWYIEAAKSAMEKGNMVYAGKYSAPDYELILSQNCGLAIESTMIYHTPEVKEKLNELGIPVLVDYSSYESNPLGRVEWMKLYSVLLGKEEEAEQLFQKQTDQVNAVAKEEKTGKTVAFFYITASGYANVRKSNDYVAKMIEMAGGDYIFEDLEESDDNALSTINMQMEEFYAKAKDTDYIIYNSTIDGELQSVDELLGKSELLSDFKSVKNGNVWCLRKSMFQETTSLGDVISDMHTMLTDGEDKESLQYLHQLK